MDHGREIQDVAAEEDGDARQEDELSLLLENIAKVQQHVRDAAQNQACDDQPRRLGPGGKQQSEAHKATGRQPLQNDGGDIVFPVLLPEEDGGKTQAEGDQNVHHGDLLPLGRGGKYSARPVAQRGRTGVGSRSILVQRGGLRFLDHLFVGQGHALGHPAAELLLQLLVLHHGAHQIHGGDPAPMLLGEIVVEAVRPIEPVIGPHEPLHLVDQIPEDLEAAHAEEVFGLLIVVFHGVGQRLGQLVDLLFRGVFVPGDPRQVVAAHLGPGLHEHPKIILPAEGPVHQIPHGLAHGHRAVAVAELAVVVQLEPIAHGMVPDPVGIDDGVGGLDVLPKIPVKAVLMDADPVGGAMEAAQAPAPEGEGPKVHHPALVGEPRPEPVDHSPQGVVPALLPVGDDHHPAGLFLRPRRRLSGHDGHKGQLLSIPPRLPVALLYLPEHEAEEGPGLPPSPLREQVLHVRGQALQIPKAHVVAVVLDEAMGGHVVEMLGSGDLGGVFPRKIQSALLHELHEAVKLGRHKERIHRVAEQNQVRPEELLPGRGKLLFILPDALPHMERLKRRVGKQLFPIFHREQGDAVLPRRRPVQHQYLHLFFPP